MTNDNTKNISINATAISIAAKPSTQLEACPDQHSLPLGIEKCGDYGDIGMGVLSDGTPYLNQRGLAALCGVENAHIGTISSQWNEEDQKPRIQKVKAILEQSGFSASATHIRIQRSGKIHYCYPADICLAILEYYAFDAGSNIQEPAKKNFRLLAGSKLKELIYRHVGYDPTGSNRFAKWHERIALNHKSAPAGYFSVFNEAHTIIYELIEAGANVGEKTVVDISIGQHWSGHWEDQNLAAKYGERLKFPHRYPASHPQSQSNPQEAWCYPVAALGEYRIWLQNHYLEGGKFSGYLKGKVNKGDLAPSVAELAVQTLITGQVVTNGQEAKIMNS
jgi:hypothetical protein